MMNIQWVNKQVVVAKAVIGYVTHAGDDGDVEFREVRNV